MTSEKKRVKSTRAGGGTKNEETMNQILLKFRPIAPKPIVVDSLVPPVQEKRSKRNNVRVKKMKINDSKKLTNLDMVDVPNGSSEIGSRRVIDPVRKEPDWISNFDVYGRSMNEINFVSGFNQIKPAHTSVDLHETNLLTTMNPRHVVESWITLESITGTCDDVKLLPDEKLVKDLEVDTCPGFVSNGYDKVEWVNLAYRRMVDPNYRDGEVPRQEVVVWLGTIVEKEKVKNLPAFSSRVRVVYQLLEKKRVSVTVPCDVWKMNSGGYAWRLDVKAALSLGRLNY